MAKKNIVSPDRQQPSVAMGGPDRQQPPMAKNMEPNMEDEITIGKREANAAYAPYFNEYNWLKAISPNLVVKIKE